MLQLSNKKNNVIFLGIFISLGILFYIGYLFHGFPMAKGQIQGQGKEVFVMYAGSLVKIFETSLGSSFQNQTGYTYEGEGKGSTFRFSIPIRSLNEFHNASGDDLNMFNKLKPNTL